MSVAVGRKIRYFRIKAKMTQEKLAQGIISVSYLSKIESDNARPSSEIIAKICKRLNLDPNKTQEDHTLNLCTTWFATILEANVDKANQLYKEIENSVEMILDAGLIKLVEIHMLHYYILTNNRDFADKQFVCLKDESSSFNTIEHYYWLKFCGNYYFSRVSYHKAFTFYRQAEKIFDRNLYSTQAEENDLYYLLSITASNIHQTFFTLVYAGKALEYYQKQQFKKRTAQCHILLGLSYYRAKEFDKAIENYKLAYKLANTMGDDPLLATCHHNLGTLYSSLDDSERAINYYLMSLKLRDENSKSDVLIPISSLMTENYKIGNIKNAKKWLEKGLILVKDLTPSETSLVYEIEVYNHLINGYGESFDKLLLNKVLPFLEEKQLLNEKFEYITILANYYFETRKYKLASIYYNLANKTLKNEYL
ncbi:helix-turn-helix domain-containing protein [Aquibacillus rhizosphaerae]|uniref:Helix-turn-helix transcriptional regulator n=1 Tax=Aquibacillus rhizosphaerae TaxID=3051431 RepID=A0ABT7L5P4_9BACI|nr:helix-turn-helix transcriptional regulator [Aquibacillus sp. LR5S19]MDL4841188.1 helix-turn-helix transcriptional regulator [Aquibacillus sp. LR5S19]